MSGNYPDLPGPRIAYDRDGTQVYDIDGAFTTVGSLRSAADMKILNDDSVDAINMSGSNPRGMIFLFPVKVDLTNALLGMTVNVFPEVNDTAALAATIQVSPDTTNGIDGTWNTVGTPTILRSPSPITIRTQIQPFVDSGVKALRIRTDQVSGFGVYFQVLHLYGTPSVAGDRLSFWHPTLDQPLSQTPAALDWGDVPRGSSDTRQFRIKNLSSTVTANAVTVAIEALTDATPSVVSQMVMKKNSDSGYNSSVAIAALAPGEVSEVITLKKDTSGSAALSLWTQRLYTSTGSWT